MNMIVFLAFVVTAMVLIVGAGRDKLRDLRHRPTSLTRPSTPRGSTGPGRSSAPKRRRKKRCAVYYYPSFIPGKEAYWGRSVDPERRDGEHRETGVDPLTGEPLGSWWIRTPYVTGPMVVYRWFDDEYKAHEFEQGQIGERASLFNIEGNFGRGIYGPEDRRLRKIHRLWLKSQKRVLV